MCSIPSTNCVNPGWTDAGPRDPWLLLPAGFSSGPVWWSHPSCVWKAVHCLLVLLLSVRSLVLAVHSRLLGVKTPRCKSCCKHNIDAGSLSAGSCRAKVSDVSSLRWRNSFILVLLTVMMCGGSFHHQVSGFFFFVQGKGQLESHSMIQIQKTIFSFLKPIRRIFHIRQGNNLSRMFGEGNRLKRQKDWTVIVWRICPSEIGLLF